ncbi:MAG TPA: cell envelope integrity protein CreD [Reyranella sp.]|jgi:inner membrane protein
MINALIRIAYAFLSGPNLLARALLLAALTLGLTVPLGLMGGIVTDRQSYQQEAVKNIKSSWGTSQTFTGPRLLVPYKDKTESWQVVFLPQKLTINGDVPTEQRRRGLFTVSVYRAYLDVVAEFDTRVLQGLPIGGNELDWSAARLLVGVSEERSLSADTVEVDGQQIEWTPDTSDRLAALQASLARIDPAARDTLTVRFRLAFAGSGSLSIVPLGQRTEVTLGSPWRSPSFIGPYLPTTQTVTREGFKATWTTSSLGRGYPQIWKTPGERPQDVTVLQSAFGVALINPVDAYRETDRAIKYGVLFIGLTFAACLLFELATGTRPHALQYGLIGLSLCVFYLLLLSFAEQIGFGPAYLVSAAAVAAQGAVYTGAVQRRVLPGLAFGGLLGVLYGTLYSLLQLEDVALLSGSILLFTLLSLAMWFTRNLHRPQPA